ncbi:helix-turn-helix domain-containing protein [Paenibacillus larvae]|nr:helix-turn-helix domain-containing protein [Paenibacillus larvae]MDT2259965.1 helix-turn-helix domain-containing protein [Paenibacillus larvae]
MTKDEQLLTMRELKSSDSALNINTIMPKTADKFQVSYQQVYSWTNKYLTSGVDALQDRRGKRKSEDEMSEVEKLRAQNKLLQAENRRKQMEIDLLKKLDEIERRRF